MRTAVRVLLATLLYTAAFAQDKPNGGKILKKLGEVYAQMSQYELKIVANIREPGSKQNIMTSAWVAFAAPDKYRVELKGPAPDRPETEGTVMVFDGSRLLMYAPKPNVYQIYDRSSLPKDSDTVSTEFSLGYGVYRQLAANAAAKFLREESLAVDGGARDCFVIVTRGPRSSLTLWIDKSTYAVLRTLGSDSSEVLYKAVRLNEPFPVDRFKFELPAGARKLGKQDPDPFAGPKKK